MKGKLLLIIKYTTALFLPLACVLIRGLSWEYMVTAIACVLLISAVTGVLCNFKIWLAYLFNTLSLLVVNVQYAVLFWSNSFITAAMLNNLDSVEALHGKAVQYAITAVLVAGFSILPVAKIRMGKRLMAGYCILCVMLSGFVFSGSLRDKSPDYALLDLTYRQLRRHFVNAGVGDMTNPGNEFFRAEVEDYVAKTEALPDKPNVILVFSEGFSRHIISDKREITPNIKALSKKSLSFDNYYNHTFATYMGLSGQLYSGYQKNNYDKNCLVSLQRVFQEYDYNTTFINTEPKNPEFTEYLRNFDFDILISDEKNADVSGAYISDKTAYEQLMKTALEQNEGDKPFFICMYTFGTHVSFDSAYEKYGDGDAPVLNRFYDLDAQVGAFIEAFESSPLFENTVFVFTADHSTYRDSDFVKAFPEYQGSAIPLDEIPLYIYHKGVAPQAYDAGGRNSLNLAPTLLDYLDMTYENYFLGESLFAPFDNENLLDTVYESTGDIYDTSGGGIHNIELEQRQDVEHKIARYFAAKSSDNTSVEEYFNSQHVFADFDAEEYAVKIATLNTGEWEALECAVWSEENDQDDLKWYRLETAESGKTETIINLSAHSSTGLYLVHLYGVKEGKKEFITATNFFVATAK